MLTYTIYYQVLVVYSGSLLREESVLSNGAEPAVPPFYMYIPSGAIWAHTSHFNYDTTWLPHGHPNSSSPTHYTHTYIHTCIHVVKEKVGICVPTHKVN